jgi:hypothetical protein
MPLGDFFHKTSGHPVLDQRTVWTEQVCTTNFSQAQGDQIGKNFRMFVFENFHKFGAIFSTEKVTY